MGNLKKTVAIQFDTNAAKAAASVRGLATANKGVEDSTNKATNSIKNQRDALESSVKEIGLYTAAFLAAAKAADELSQRAMALDDVTRNLPFSIDAAKKASKGLVDTFTLQQQAMAANTLGAAKSSKEFEKLVKVATTLARAQGKDATKGVEDFTTALARGSPQILDNLGLTLKMSEAQRIYADHLGVSVGDLSEVAKAEAFRFAALQKGEETIKNITLAEESFAINLQKTKVELIETGDALIRIANKIGTATEKYEIFDNKLSQLTGLSNLTINAMDAAEAIRALDRAMSPDVVHGELLFDDTDQLRRENAAAKSMEDAQALGSAWQEAIDQQREYEKLQEQDQRNYLAQVRQQRGRGRSRGQEQIDQENVGDFTGPLGGLRGRIGLSAEESEALINEKQGLADATLEIDRQIDEEQARFQERTRARFEERIRQIEAEKAAEQAKLKSISRGISEWGQLAGESAAIGSALADAQGMSAERAARLQNRFLGMQAFGRAALEIVEAVAAAARYDYAGAALHSAAASLGIVKGSLLVSGALDPSGGGGDVGGGATAVTSMSAPSGGSGPNLPESPVSRPNTQGPPPQGGQNTSPSTGQTQNVVVIENFNTLGTTNDEVATSIQQMLDDRDRQVGNA